MKLPALLVDGFDDCQLNFESLQQFFSTLPLTGKSWIAPTLVNSWANTGTGENAGYLKDPFGFVHLIGRLAGGATNTTAFTLPAGYRPGGVQTFPAGTFNGAAPISGGVAISPAGVVAFFYAAGATDLSISGITFLAEN